MSFYTDVRVIQTGTGTGDLTAVTGLPSAPKALILLGVNRNGAGVAPDYQVGLGACTSATERWCTAAFGDDAVGTTDTAHVWLSDQCFAQLNNATTVGGKLDLKTTGGFTSDGYVLTVDVAFAADTSIIVMAIGGTDVTAAKAYSEALSASTGGIGYTTAGFEPTWNLMALPYTVAAGTVQARERFGLGVATDVNGAVEQWSIAQMDNDAVTTTDSRGTISTVRCATFHNPGGPLESVSFVSNDATGVTLDRTIGGGSPTMLLLSVAGGQVKIDTTTWRTDTGDNDINTLTFQPAGVLVAAHPGQTATSNGITAEGSMAVGVASSASARASVWWGSDSGLVLGSTQCNQALSTTRIVIDYDVTDGTTLASDIDVKDFDATGVTFDQMTLAGAATLMGVLYLGPNVAAGGGQPAMRRLRQPTFGVKNLRIN